MVEDVHVLAAMFVVLVLVPFTIGLFLRECGNLLNNMKQAPEMLGEMIHVLLVLLLVYLVRMLDMFVAVLVSLITKVSLFVVVHRLISGLLHLLVQT